MVNSTQDQKVFLGGLLPQDLWHGLTHPLQGQCLSSIWIAPAWRLFVIIN